MKYSYFRLHALLHYYATFVGLPSLKRPIARAGPNRAKNELEDICLIIQQLDACHLLNKLPKFYIADLDLISTIKVSDVDVVMLAKRLDRIEQRLLAFDSLDKILDTIDQKMAMMAYSVQPSGVLSSIRNSDSVNKSYASVVNSADSSVTMEPLGVSLDDIPSINIPTTLTQHSAALMSLAVACRFAYFTTRCCWSNLTGYTRIC